MELLFLPLKPPNVSLLGTASEAAAKDLETLPALELWCSLRSLHFFSPLLGKKREKNRQVKQVKTPRCRQQYGGYQKGRGSGK